MSVRTTRSGQRGGSGDAVSVPNNSSESEKFKDSLADVQAQFDSIHAKLDDVTQKYDDVTKQLRDVTQKYDDVTKKQVDMRTELDKLKKCAKCSKIRNENWHCEGCVHDRA